MRLAQKPGKLGRLDCNFGQPNHSRPDLSGPNLADTPPELF
jgi:hypothetical protein